MKTLLIIARECRLRLRRPAFWVLTLAVPAVLALLYALPVIAARQAAERTTVLVADQSGLFQNGLVSTDELAFKPMPSLEYAHREAGSHDLVLFIPMRETTIPHDAFLYYRGTPPSPAVQSAVDAQLQNLLRNAILEDVYEVDPSIFHSVETTHLRLRTSDAATGHESHLQVKAVVAVALAVVIALALLLFGAQVVRAVQEERHNRVAEIVATSVRPVQLLAGKVAGVALTAVLQLILWVSLTAAAIAGVQAANPTLFEQARAEQQMHSFATKGEAATAQYNAPVQLVDQTVQGLAAIQLPVVAGAFVLFFLLGYLLYGALLAAIAARLDAEADATQWALLVGSPLLLALALAPLVLRAPAGALATWLTVIPFTAPVAAMLRLPFGLPIWQVAAAAALLLLFAAAAALLAARTYRRRIV
ncbi:MAG: ABC transporter permease [Bacteroidales bacterium]|nr:ABC transporter permease [Bacteroidales bacterium]